MPNQVSPSPTDSPKGDGSNQTPSRNQRTGHQHPGLPQKEELPCREDAERDISPAKPIYVL
jgi:hypothetical protein